jgi:hypothetical protein
VYIIKVYGIVKKKRIRRLNKNEIEASLVKSVNIINAVVKLGKTLIIVGGIVAIAYFTMNTIKILAGKTTIADIMFSFLADLKINQWLAYMVGGSGVLYGTVQSKLKAKTTKRFARRINELETQINPNKLSSNLTLEGKTNRSDI